MFLVVSWVNRYLTSAVPFDNSTSNEFKNTSEKTTAAQQVKTKLEEFTEQKAKQFATLEQNEKSQFSTYLAEGVLHSSTDPLQFWGMKQTQCRHLCRVEYFLQELK